MGGEIKLSVQRQKGLTGYCFKYTDRPFCLRTDEMQWAHKSQDHNDVALLILISFVNPTLANK